VAKLSKKGRIALYREARVILAVATTTTKPTRYQKIAKDFGLREDAAFKAEEIWNNANGPGDWSVESEERALDHVRDLLDMEMQDV